MDLDNPLDFLTDEPDEAVDVPVTPAAPVAALPDTHRDVQRRALRDLVNLSTECTRREQQVAATHEQALDHLAKDAKRLHYDLEDRFKRTSELIEAKFAEQTQLAHVNHRREAGSAAGVLDGIKRRVELDTKTFEREVKKEFDQAAWLAESVFEATDIQLREEAKAIKEKVAGHVETLDALEDQATGLMETYNQKPLPAEDPAPPEIAANAAEVYAAQLEAAQGAVARLGALKLPRLFIGGRPVFIPFLLMVLAGGVAQVASGQSQPMFKLVGYSAGATLVGVVGIGLMLRVLARNHVREAYVPVRIALDNARRATTVMLKNWAKEHEERHEFALMKRKSEVQRAKDKAQPLIDNGRKQAGTLLANAQADYENRTRANDAGRDAALAAANLEHEKAVTDLKQGRERHLQTIKERQDRKAAEAAARHAEARAQLEAFWADGLAGIQAPMNDAGGGALPAPLSWDDPAWAKWLPPKKFAEQVRFGELQVDLPTITKNVPQTLTIPPQFNMAAYLAFPRQASLLINTDRAGRAEAVRAMQMVMARLLTSLPAGRVRFTIIDPVGLGQNFAGFMHLADHDENLVGGRIWTEAEQIEQRLANLTEHMETVIQKYLRNEYETIDQYNAQAAELAEPYRFLVVADFPTGFAGDAFRRLASIAGTGARCGVYTLIMRDTRLPLPSGARVDDVEAHSVTLSRENERFVWKDEVFKQFPLTLDAPPAEEALTRILEVVGEHAKEANRVEVPFSSIAPDEREFWSGSTKSDIAVPIGRSGATRLQQIKLGRGVAQHVLIAGKTGSGKSTLLHALITNMAMWYTPEEVEFYLVDFKKGVEFKTYATHVLPHARAVAVESDREFGLSVLQRIDAELTRRGSIFRKLGVQDLAAYRDACADPMPRTLLIIDEFQEFFSEDDKLAQDAAVLLDRLVRQGRAFGIHVLLGSQTIGGTSGLSRSTIGQMAVRVALQCNEVDSQLILGDNNSAARLLSRPGEAIYNDAGGLVEGNSPFQVAWLPDAQREEYLIKVRQRATLRPHFGEPAVVFEGNVPADVTKNDKLGALLAGATYPARPGIPLGWLGEPVAIKDPTAIAFRRQAGANALIVGQQDEAALAMMSTAIISLAAQLAPAAARFVIFDGSAADSPLAGRLGSLKEFIPHEMAVVEYRDVDAQFAELGEELGKRMNAGESNPPAVFIFIYGLQRYRALRKQEESFSFSGGSEDAPKKVQPDKVFAELLREGPANGMHVIAWCDTPASVERTLDRHAMREFDNRILFQMSAADSSNLIDSPVANKLGLNRALAFSEEQGTMEKFRPYAIADAAFLERVKERLGRR